MFSMARLEGCNFVTLMQTHWPFWQEEQGKMKLDMDLTHALVHILPMTLSVSLVEYKERSHSASFSLLIHHCFVPILWKATFSTGTNAWLESFILWNYKNHNGNWFRSKWVELAVSLICQRPTNATNLVPLHVRNAEVCMSGISTIFFLVRTIFLVDLRVQKSELFELIENVRYIRIMKL